MNRRRFYAWTMWIMLLGGNMKSGQAQTPKFRALVLTERGGQHEKFVVAALVWLEGFANEKQFEFDVINEAKLIDAAYLAKYQLVIQLNYPPYTWTKEGEDAFVRYIEEGKGGWVGFHHATLLGEFDHYPMWTWFSDFMGSIRFKNYIATRATATVVVEDMKHPVMKGLPETFTIPDDEWYIFDKNPRPNVHVLANVDESTYRPSSDIKMGDHPVIWSNEKMKARNVYFLMGHHANLLKTEAFKQLFANAILWAAAGKDANITDKKSPNIEQ